LENALKSTYRDTEIITMGPPSSGGAHVIQMLNILESHNLSKIEHNSSEYINLLTEIMKYAYAIDLSILVILIIMRCQYLKLSAKIMQKL
jgi:gamma-glutamyltranspeptidase